MFSLFPFLFPVFLSVFCFCLCVLWVGYLFVWLRNMMRGVNTGMNQALFGSNPLATIQGLCGRESDTNDSATSYQSLVTVSSLFVCVFSLLFSSFHICSSIHMVLVHPVVHPVLMRNMSILLMFVSNTVSFTALAASGGQLPISSLEGSSKVLIGSSGGQGAGFPSSLFLNHSSLLPMATGTGMGLGSSALAKTSFPVTGGMSPSPCSSPISSCSSGELLHSPHSIGGAKIEWRCPRPITWGGEGGD